MKRRLHQLILLAALLIAIYPLCWMLFSSLKTNQQIDRNLWLPTTSPTLANYASVWNEGGFPRYLLNSALLTGGTVVLLLGTGALAGYGFARYDFRGKRLLWLCFLGGLFLPGHVALIPLHLLQATVQMTRGPYALLYLGGVYLAFNLSFTVYFLRGFYADLPQDLDDAAQVDGCGSWARFWRIMLPLSAPALLVAGLVNAVLIWNEFIFALILLHEPATYTLPLAVMRFSDDTSMDLALTTAALSLAILPILLLFLIGQRWIIQGLTQGAVKG